MELQQQFNRVNQKIQTHKNEIAALTSKVEYLMEMDKENKDLIKSLIGIIESRGGNNEM